MHHNDPKTDARTVEHTVEYGAGDQRPVSMVVVSAIAALADADPTEIEPLYYSIDPDVLDRLFGPREGTPPDSRRLQFGHAGYQVTIDADPDVTITVTDE